MAKAGRARRQTCPACGTAGSYRPDDPPVCKVCGTRLDAPASAVASGVAASAPIPAPSTGASGPRAEPPTALAVVSLACGIVSFMTLWVQPISFLLMITAVVTGIIALSRHEGDSGVQVMAGLGIGLAACAFLVLWFVCVVVGACGPGSSWEFSSSGDTDEGGGSGSDTGGGGGGSGGSEGEGGGGSSGEGGGSGAADTGGDVAAPMPVALLGGIGLLAAAAWRRRA